MSNKIKYKSALKILSHKCKDAHTFTYIYALPFLGKTKFLKNYITSV